MVKKRNGEIDTLRFLFALIILVHHLSSIMIHPHFSAGYVGVEFFFLVAGYFMAAHAFKLQDREEKKQFKQTWSYLSNKVKSFYPYYLCAIVCTLIIRKVIILKFGLKPIIMSVVVGLPSFCLTFMGTGLVQDAYAGGTWFLSSMLLAMLILYPILLRWFDAATNYIFPIITILLLGYLNMNYAPFSKFNNWTGLAYVGTLRAIAEIALGASIFSLCRFLQSSVVSRETSFAKVSFTVLRILCYFSIIYFAWGESKEHVTITSLYSCALALILLFSGSGYMIPDSAFTRFLGKISLPIYIFHGFIRLTVIDLLGEKKLSFAQTALIAGGIVLLCLLLMVITDCLKRLFVALGKKLFITESE